MPAVKAEKIEVRGIPGSNPDSVPASSRPSNDHQRQYVLDRSDRLRENSLPYRRPGPHAQHPPPVHPTILAQAIGQATHEALLGTRNAVYLCALREITEARSVAATYQRQAIQFHRELSDARYAYTQLLSRTKTPSCQQEGRTEENILCVFPPVQPIPAPNAPASMPTPAATTARLQPLSAPTAMIREPVQASAPPTTHTNQGHPPVAAETNSGLTPQKMALGESSGLIPGAIVSHMNSRPTAGQAIVPSYSGPVPGPTLQELYGPIALAGGFKIISCVGPLDTTPHSRPDDLPVRVFWLKSDWFGKGYPNGTFVTDRNGNHLKHLMKGIRKMARKIWTELEKRPSSCVATTFNKNGLTFMSDYVRTIEETYPCLKLCSGHWKAKQIGIAAYSHWYKNRSRYLDDMVSV